MSEAQQQAKMSDPPPAETVAQREAACRDAIFEYLSIPPDGTGRYEAQQRIDATLKKGTYRRAGDHRQVLVHRPTMIDARKGVDGYQVQAKIVSGSEEEIGRILYFPLFGEDSFFALGYEAVHTV